MFAGPGVVLFTFHHPRPKTDSQTLSLGPRLQPHQLGCTTVLPHMVGQSLTQYPSLAAQNSVTS